MANNWKYYQQTLQGGGLGTDVCYVDSHNGSDVTGDGSHDNPFASIQAGIDLGSSADFILAGIFEGSGAAGDFIGNPAGAFIAEGYVVFDGQGVGVALQKLGYSWNVGYRQSLNNRFLNGTFAFKNYTVPLEPQVIGAKAFNVEMYNCIAALKGATGTILRAEDCYFEDCNVGSVHKRFEEGIRNCSFVRSSFTAASSAYGQMENLFFDATSTYYCLYAGGPNLVNCFFEGTLTNKIRLVDGYHDNIESAEAAFPLRVKNNLPSATVPLFNLVNGSDYTLQESSPLKKAGVTSQQIGYFKVAKAVEMDDVTWTVVGVDNTTVPGEAILNASPTGTITSSAIDLFPKKREWTRINLPDFERNSPLGEMIGDLASYNTPYIMSVEVQHSIDNITYSSWLKMAVGVKPMHDTINDVGTADAAYNIDNAEAIVAKYMKMRITLRDNETQV